VSLVFLGHQAKCEIVTVVGRIGRKIHDQSANLLQNNCLTFWQSDIDVRLSNAQTHLLSCLKCEFDNVHILKEHIDKSCV